MALGAALESSAMYRDAARRWDGAVCLQRTEADLRHARFVISGPLTACLTVLRGDEAPTVALMRGHLTLAKGMLPMLLLRLATLFQGGEEAVVIDILPLLDAVSQERRLDEQLYLTSFVWEEAKHVEGMHRFLHAVGALDTDLTRSHTPAYHTIFTDALPQAMHRLRHDASPVAQARASATYNMIVEGVLAETA